MTWEQSHQTAMRWILDMQKNTTCFIQQEAQWYDVEKANVFATLIGFEQQLLEQKDYATALYSYREFENVCHVDLPTHIKSRQRNLEDAFSELTQRVTWARLIVEQYAIVSDLLANADTLRTEGGLLKKELETATSDHLLEFNERVARFQDKVMCFTTSVTSRIPQQANEEASEVIRKEIRARKTELLALSKSLDQGITLLRRAIQSQKRFVQLQGEVNRLAGWANERLKSIEKLDINVLAVGKCGLDSDAVSRLMKESNGQSAKLDGIIERDLVALKDKIQSLSTHGILEKVQLLNDNTKALETLLSELKDSIRAHYLRLEVLKLRISWETRYTEAVQWVSYTTLEVWDFISRKAQWRMAANMDEERQTKLWESMVKDEWEGLSYQVQNFRDGELISVHKTFFDMKNGFGKYLFLKKR
jgi:hypothetical protein